MESEPELPKKSLENRSGDYPANQKPGGDANANGIIETPSGNVEDWISAYEILGGIIFAIVGVGLSDVGFHKWGLFFYFLGVACGILAFCHRIKKSIKYIRTLLGMLLFLDLALFAFEWRHVYSEEKSENKINQTKSQEWQPPELPKDCKDVVIWFGGQGQIYKMDWLTNYPYPPDKATAVPIPDLPESVRTNLPNMPGFSPYLKTVLGLFEVVNKINGKKEDFYPVLPQVISNRLYVFVKIPFTKYQRIVMSDEMDSVLTNCLPQSPAYWDRNYSLDPKTNVFEIVNENKNPIVQVIYKSPREVLVNGVFFVSHYDIQATYEGKNPGFFSIPNIITNISSDQFNFVFTNQFGGTIPTNQPLPGKHLFPIYQGGFGATNLIMSIAAEDVYAGFATNQKAIFKYPHNIFPGEFAEENEMVKKTSSDIALFVGYGVVWFGILWMCFGWIFFQKRTN